MQVNDSTPHGELFDLLDPGLNRIYNMSDDEAGRRVKSGDPALVRGIEGSYSLVVRDGVKVRMARSLDRPLRFFLAKRGTGPALVVSDRIDGIHRFLVDHGLEAQFQPSYTRMVPAHHILEVSLRGCPDPSPLATRFFHPDRTKLPAELDSIAREYIGAVHTEIVRWLETIDPSAPIGVSFSGGIDSGAVLLLIHHALGRPERARQRLKAFTLDCGGGSDCQQARSFLEQMGLSIYGEVIEANLAELDPIRTVRVIEDYKQLDVQAATAYLALLEGIRRRYPDWLHMADGDGADENLKDYPIEQNPELTIRSVLSNPMLYQEGWGVGALKHSQTYSGGQSRSCVRTYAPERRLGFAGFHPFAQPDVIAVAEAIPFVELTGWSVESLYRLKGEITRRGVELITGLTMPIQPKRRFQHGIAPESEVQDLFGETETRYRRALDDLYVRPTVSLEDPRCQPTV